MAAVAKRKGSTFEGGAPVSRVKAAVRVCIGPGPRTRQSQSVRMAASELLHASTAATRLFEEMESFDEELDAPSAKTKCHQLSATSGQPCRLLLRHTASRWLTNWQRVRSESPSPSSSCTTV
eukprot:scaffold138786_cov31-Tisochrysis_lutea.AAC.2